MHQFSCHVCIMKISWSRPFLVHISDIFILLQLHILLIIYEFCVYMLSHILVASMNSIFFLVCAFFFRELRLHKEHLFNLNVDSTRFLNTHFDEMEWCFNNKCSNLKCNRMNFECGQSLYCKFAVLTE